MRSIRPNGALLSLFLSASFLACGASSNSGTNGVTSDAGGAASIGDDGGHPGTTPDSGLITKGDDDDERDAGSTRGDDGASDGSASTSTGTSDQVLLDEVQKHSVAYFWDFGHPVSGMARERSTSGDTVTTGGTGFGISAIVAAVSRGWISRSDAVTRLTTMVTFLSKADRFHGAFSHWLNGGTGKVIPFSAQDDGGDLVETAYLTEGLMIARAYFDGTNASETALRSNITAIVNAIEWDWYATRGDGELSWHWSPDHNFDEGLAVVGYDEALITYILALGSTTHPIATSVYSKTWFGSGYNNGQTYDGYTLPIGTAHGGPLFFAHYSFLGLDPRAMQDSHAYFWTQNVNDVLQNRAYCIKDASTSYGYGPELWGVTASDGPDGYGAWSPTNDNGTIAPTAALASMPYAPYRSLQVLRHLLNALGDETFKPYGFVDSLNPSRGFYDNDFLAIDQGPIAVMIENYRSGLLWKLGATVPEMKSGLTKASIHPPTLSAGFYLAIPDAESGDVDLVRHPDRGDYELDVALTTTGAYTLVVEDAETNVVANVWSGEMHPAGTSVVSLGRALTPGSYVAHLAGASLDRRLPLALH